MNHRQPLHLPYAAGRTQVVRAADEVVVTIPAPGGVAFWMWATFLAGVAAFLLLGAFWPAGTTVIWGSIVRHPGGVAARVIPSLLAAFILWVFADFVRRHRAPVTLCIRGAQLTCHVPGFRAIRTKTYDLSQFRSAKVSYHEDGDPLSLELLGGPSGFPTRLFDARHYCKTDLETAAEVLCAAFIRLAERRVTLSGTVPSSTPPSPSARPPAAGRVSS